MADEERKILTLDSSLDDVIHHMGAVIGDEIACALLIIAREIKELKQNIKPLSPHVVARLTRFFPEDGATWR